MLFCNDKVDLYDMLVKELNDKYFDVTVFNDKVNKSDINKSLELLLVDIKKSRDNNLSLLSHNQEDIIKEAILCKIPILFLNVDNEEYLKKIVGVGVKGDWILLKPYGFYNVIDVADEGSKPKYESKTLVSCNNEDFEVDNIKRNYKYHDNMSLKKYVKNAAARINYAVNEEFAAPDDVNDMPALPVSQYNLNYIRMVKDYGLTNT